MPNWTTVRVEAAPEVLEALIKEGSKKPIESDDFTHDVVVDFNKLIPMPNHIYRGPIGDAERDLYGKDNWHDWSLEHWGTKWNASRSTLAGDNVLYFQTAWNEPGAILEALHEKFPEESIKIAIAYEDYVYAHVKLIKYHEGELSIGSLRPGNTSLLAPLMLGYGSNKSPLEEFELNEEMKSIIGSKLSETNFDEIFRIGLNPTDDSWVLAKS